jgi:peptide/nickel transport system permease protein
MASYVINRLIQGAVILFAMTFIVFVGLNVIGNPIDIMVAPDCDFACRDAAMKTFGLDRSLPEQYGLFLMRMLAGDFGLSFVFGLPALDLILSRMPATLELACAAMLIALVVGLPLGLWAGIHPHSIAGRTITALSILGFSLPAFWVGIMLIMFFSVELGLLPVTGRGATREVLGIELSILTLDGWRHLLLPALNLALLKISLTIRLVYSGVREVILLDYVRFAKAKGLSRQRIIFVHVLKNVMIPVVTVLGMEFGTMIAFAVVTETIFSWPGMGKLLIDAINMLDRPVIVTYLVVAAAMFVMINLVVDVICAFLNPRIRVGSALR